MLRGFVLAEISVMSSRISSFKLLKTNTFQVKYPKQNYFILNTEVLRMTAR